MRQIFSGGPVMPYLLLQVDRANLLQSTLAQVGQFDGTMLKKQLKVRFLDEEGVDEGGVKKGRWVGGWVVVLCVFSISSSFLL